MPFSHKDVERYVQYFNQETKDTVLRELLEVDCLKSAFESTEGKAVLNGLVDEIGDNVIKIIRECQKENGEYDDLYEYGKNINIAYRMLYRYALILQKGEAHIDIMEKAKNEQ